MSATIPAVQLVGPADADLDERAPGAPLQTVHFELDVTALPGNPGRPTGD